MFDGLRAHILIKTKNHLSFIKKIENGNLNLKNSEVLNSYIDLLSTGINNYNELMPFTNNETLLSTLYFNINYNIKFRNAIKEYYERQFMLNDFQIIKNLTEDTFFEQIIIKDYKFFKDVVDLNLLNKNLDLKLSYPINNNSLNLDDKKRMFENLLELSTKIEHNFNFHKVKRIIENLKVLNFYEQIEKIYDKALFDSDLFKILFDGDWKEYYQAKKEVEMYINFTKNNGFMLKDFIQTKEDIFIYFNALGPTEKLYEKALFDFDLFKILFEGEWKEYYQTSKEVEQYIEYIKNNGFILWHFINKKSDILLYFNGLGPTERLYEKALFPDLTNSYLFNKVFTKEDWKKYYHASKAMKHYIEFTKNNGLILKDLICKKDDVLLYFNDDGPTDILYDKILSNLYLFIEIFVNGEYWKKSYHVPKELEQYIKFTKNNGFVLWKFINKKEDLLLYFNDNGPKKETWIQLLKNDIDNEILNNSSLDKYYKDLYSFYTNNIEVNLLDKFNNFINNELIHGNYIVLLKLMIEMDYNQQYILMDKGLPNTTIVFNYFNNEQLNDICKYCLLYNDNSMEQFCNIVSSKNIYNFMKIYNFLFDKWNIDDFKSLLSNYMNNYELCESIVEYIDSVSDFTVVNFKEKIKKVLVFGDKSAARKIMTVDDLNNYEQLIYNNNLNLINSTYDIHLIKSSIYNLLFNLSTTDIKKVLERYNYNDSKLNNIMKTLNNNDLKEKVYNIDIILKFIDTLENEKDINKLKKYLKIVNENYLNNSQEMEVLWSYCANIDREINKILGMEINEKITDFSELLKLYKQGNIPLNNYGTPLFNVTYKKLNNDFEYDGKIFKAGTDIPYIELTGLPFVTFGHVLNAYGSGGKVSDFNNPRLIGRTHLCLSAIDDNYYKLVEKSISDIDHVQLLFSSLPAEQLVMASERDLVSSGEDNSRNITSYYKSNYNTVRENISNTWHGAGGYNEYVYYRDNIKPSAVLIKGEEPSEVELQAATYLRVPLVKINEYYYPKLNQRKMKQKDRQLEAFYKKGIDNKSNKIKLKLVHEQLGTLISTYKNIDTSFGGKTI